MKTKVLKGGEQRRDEGRDVTRPAVDIVATVPPPINGNTLITQRVIEWLRDHCDAHVFAISSTDSLAGLAAKGIRAWKNLAACLWLLTKSQRANRNLYSVANAGVGMFYTMSLLGLARLRGYRCILQHHSYSYITKFDWRMKFIDWVIGEDGCHVVSCADMGVKFQRTYNSRRKWFTVPNTFMMPAVEVSPGPYLRDANGVMTIGHLSNLCFEKGIDTVIDVFSELWRRDLPVRLVLAGPPVSKDVAALIDRARDEFGDALVYLGPVRDDDKWAFFNEIDVFLFPTRYKIEAQPVVVFEALSFGRPVIAYGRGCIPGMIETEGGCVIDVEDSFVAQATSIIEKWIHDPAEFRDQVHRVSSRANTLRASAEPSLRRLARALKQ